MLIAEDETLIAGHGRVLAARLLGMDTGSTITLAGLSEAQRRALVLADNRIALNAGWDEALLALELSDLKEAGIDLGISGFEDGELDRPLSEAEEDEDPTGPVVIPEPPRNVFGLHMTLAQNLRIGAVFTALCRARHNTVYAERMIMRSRPGMCAASS